MDSRTASQPLRARVGWEGEARASPRRESDYRVDLHRRSSLPHRRKVLFVTTRYPYPPNRGDRLHAYHLIRVLSGRFDMTVAAFEDAEDDVGSGEARFAEWGVRTVRGSLSALGRRGRLLAALFSGEPLQIAYYQDPGFKRRLRDLARADNFDAICCHLVRSAHLVRGIAAPLRVISLCDSMALNLELRLRYAPRIERPSVRLELGRIRRYERAVLEEFDEGWLVSARDLDSFPEHQEKIRIIPNGVDLEVTRPIPLGEREPVVGFLGHLGVPHNVDAARYLVREVGPLLRGRFPESRIELIGADPSPSVRELADDSFVKVRGFVPNLGDAIARWKASCAPIRFSSGLQNKLLEAMAAGVPVVTTPGPAQALGADAHRWVGVAESPAGFVERLAEVWEPSPVLESRVAAAQDWVHRTFRWDRFAERLEELLEEREKALPSQAGQPELRDT